MRCVPLTPGVGLSKTEMMGLLTHILLPCGYEL